ncbi:stress responsive A/B barrel domain-containing protein [Phanerochaete sordida]|uniref:Stress responsive A/B barrel domain-containing protein n=1 Tax=Phanerochaete sordida TaxID=48140 RepID=A0A9P3GAQ6_9APHY|nr:stress responsive A/B barrel domain-containing protein [Phanerochaete sordida]
MSALLSSPFALRLGFAFTALTTVCLLYTTLLPRSPALYPPPRGAVVHIVLFQYAPDVSAETRQHVATAFLALQDACRLPGGARYVQAADGGANSSPEGRTHGMEHAFVLTFRSAAERDYYLDADPAHQAFKASIAEKVADALVFDFESGDFARRARARRRRPSDELHVRTV